MSDFVSKAVSSVGRFLQRASGKHPFTSAIIVAAGSSVRMGSTMTKQMTPLDGLPVIVRTIQQFEACPSINEIIIVARREEIIRYDRFMKEYHFEKITHVVPGGDTRQKSVLCGFEVISDKADYIAIHDGARCLITPDRIEQVLREAKLRGAALAAQRIQDTVKQTDSNALITQTLDRNLLWRAQTPQIFRTDIYRTAAYAALESGYEATDDSMLAEYVGFPVKVVDCGSENIKITTQEDLYFAAAVLKKRKESAARKENTDA